ncbi:MAG TPA: type VI secretion system protein TssL [Gammaproteobacteria bacterium]|nr:type VI secretion system protein TssL [Gammaproteobacteria bacterium]
MSEEAAAAKADEGAPAWVMTFADLMSLLMCFFVLLLSFSEMDVSKYKEMAGSLKNAFGVQRDIKVKEPPKGINVIAREFSPGRPEPTTMNVIRQMTTNDLRVNLDLGKERRRPVPTPKAEHIPDREKSYKPHEPGRNKADRQAGQKAGQKADLKAGASSGKLAHLMPGKQRSQTEGLSAAQKKALLEAKKLAAERLSRKLEAERKLLSANNIANAVTVDRKSVEELLKARAAAEKRRKLQQRARLISKALGKEIKAGTVDVETDGQKIIIRVREKASFASGRAELKEGFRPILARVAKILEGSEGKIIVAGHTDNVPIYTRRFRSNWELSAARAVSVAHEMMLATNIPSSRFLVQGFADTEPVAKNDTPAHRARNRRVEIILQQGEDRQGGVLGAAGGGGKAAKAGTGPAPTSSRVVKKTGGAGAVRPKVRGIRAGGSAGTAGHGVKAAQPAAGGVTVKGIRAAGHQ